MKFKTKNKQNYFSQINKMNNVFINANIFGINIMRIIKHVHKMIIVQMLQIQQINN